MANRSKAIGTRFESALRDLVLRRVWPRIERTGSKVAFGQLADFDDPDRRCPWAWEAKAGEQQRIEKWWEQAKASAEKAGLLAGLLWRRKGRPADPWVIFTWSEFEPVAAFVTAHFDEFQEWLQRPPPSGH